MGTENFCDVLDRLSATLLDRRYADPATSYSARLFAKAPDSILKKIGEECAELIMAGKVGDKPQIVYEAADVLYHLLVLLTHYDLSAADVLEELSRREGISGITEKAARKNV